MTIGHTGATFPSYIISKEGKGRTRTVDRSLARPLIDLSFKTNSRAW